MASEDVLEWAETSVGLLFDANYSEREALFIQNTIDRLAAEVRELRKDRARLDWILSNGPIDVRAEDEWAVVETRAEIDAAMGGEG